MVLDKSYKLTNASNVKDDLVVTNNNSITVFGLYTYNRSANTGDFLDHSLSLMFNAQNEISDKDFTDNIIYDYNNTVQTYNVGGKNYTLNLDQLKQDLAGWFSNHSSYNSTLDVFNSTTPETDINSLMAVYTKDTAECFVKA